MKKVLSIIICIICQIAVSNGEQFKDMQKPIFRYIHYTNGKANFFFDSKLLYERIKQRTIEKNSLANLNDNLSFEVFPNPISKNASISFNLITNSNVKIYVYDNIFNVKNLFEGRLNKGNQEFTYDLTELNKGMVLFYIEINGKIYTTKSLKI